ncbi:MAG: SDR family oxidoreductase [Gammaproteobacteria bacterium]|nr:SDR family oxidoreductase [Gammaproteobacteria bacterium]
MANYLIIAGTSTIGTQLAENLLRSGHSIFITGREKSKIANLAEKLNVKYSILDATNFDDVDHIFELAKNEMGVLHGVVNFAGSLLLKPAHLTTKNEYSDVIAANLTSAFAVTAAAGKHLAKQNGGSSVVLISSAAALAGFPNHEAISAAKAGIIGLALSAAATYASSNIRFNVIAPGLVETHLTTSLTNNNFSRKASESMHALGRIGTPSDIASAICFFLNPENSWITGQILAVDGGLSRIHSKTRA